MTQARLVTIVGPTGVGKSCLATALVGSEARKKPSGWCDLAGAHRFEDVCVLLAAAVGVRISGGGNPGEALFDAIDRLGDHTIVLDNLEPPTRETAEFLQELTERAPRARIVVTSHGRVGVAAETSFVLGPLALPPLETDDPQRVFAAPSVRLFLQRARALDLRYRVDREEAALLARLVHELDGLPLALELCAGRATVLSIAQLLEMLESRFELLVGPDPGRHGTLQRALDAAWSALESPQQQVLAACSVFAGGWDLDAAVAVLGARPIEIARQLQELHDRSWVRTERPDGSRRPPRYHLLESIRAYASAKADEAQTRASLLLHARFYSRLVPLDLATRDGGEVDAALEALLREFRNLEQAYRTAMDSGPEGRATAVEICIELEPIHRRRGSPRRLAGWLADAMKGASLTPDLAVRGLLVQAVLAYCEGDLSCLEIAEQAQDLLGHVDDPALEATLLIWLATFHAVLLSAKEAGPLLDEARTRLLRYPDRMSELARQVTEALAAVESAPADDAIGTVSQLARTCRAVGSERDLGLSSFYLACTLYRRGELPEARRHWQDAERLFQSVGDERATWITRTNFGLLAAEEGRPDEARALLQECYEQLMRLGFISAAVVSCGMLGDVELEIGSTEAALAAYERALGSLANVDNSQVMCLGLARLGITHARSGRASVAQSLLDEARKVAESIPATFAAVAVHLHLGQLEVVQAERALAEGHRTAALQLLESAEARLLVGRGRTANSDVRFARRMLERAIEGSRESLGPIPCLRVGPDLSWVDMSGRGALALDRRPTMRRLVAALVDRRLRDPGGAVSVEDLFRAGWPGERASWSSSVHRVQVMVTRLRQLAIGELLEHHREGYRLAPDLRIEQAPLGH